MKSASKLILLLTLVSSMGSAHPVPTDKMSQIPKDSTIQTGSDINFLPNARTHALILGSDLNCGITYTPSPSDRVLRAGRIFRITSVKPGSQNCHYYNGFESCERYSTIIEVSGAQGITSFYCEKHRRPTIQDFLDAINGFGGTLRFSAPIEME